MKREKDSTHRAYNPFLLGGGRGALKQDVASKGLIGCPAADGPDSPAQPFYEHADNLRQHTPKRALSDPPPSDVRELTPGVELADAPTCLSEAHWPEALRRPAESQTEEIAVAARPDSSRGEAVLHHQALAPVFAQEGREERMTTLRLPPSVAGQSVVEALAPGRQVGQYELIRELGSGGMGVVFLARDGRLGRRVAIKFLHARDPEVTQRFIVEARATAQCGHENIVVIHEVGVFQGSPFMVLEYLEGQTLAAVLRKSGALAPTRAVELVAAVVRALVCAHDQGIIHRDLKPENIFVTNAGQVKVLDFGVAKILDSEREHGGADPQAREARRNSLRLHAAGAEVRSAIVGTIGYMSPEQWGAGGPIDHRSDIWAVGIILFELLSGSHPFASMARNIWSWVVDLDQPVANLRDVAPQIGAELAAVVQRCLQKRKADRFADSATLLRALEPFLPGRFSAPPLPIENGPYAGLRSFQEADAGRFFGRHREIGRMLTQLRELPFITAIGGSGIGKSSFVRAGVIPALKRSGEPWDAFVVRPGRDPLLALAGLIATMISSSVSVADDLGAQAGIAARLGKEPGYFGSVVRNVCRRRMQRVLVFVDQFEELYTLGADSSTRRAFSACLSAAADDSTSPIRIIASIRSDFLGRIAEDPPFLHELSKGFFFLGPPDREGLREAIVQPAEMAGYHFEASEMVEEILDHLEASPGALPLVQFTVSQLWEQRDAVRKTLTRPSYVALGGIAGALANHADRVIRELAPEMRELCRPLFVGLVTADRTRAIRSEAELREISQAPETIAYLIEQLVESRLLVVQTNEETSETTVEIIHESLIQTWPALRRWLDETLEDSTLLEQLRASARQWEAKKFDPGLLWTGEMVEELRRFQRRSRGPLPHTVSAFVQAVLEQHARIARRRKLLFATVCATVVALLSAAAVALVVIRDAQKVAEKNAALASAAEAVARERFGQLQDKELSRAQTELQRLEALKEMKAAVDLLRQAQRELEDRNAQLQSALVRTQSERRRADAARDVAQQHESHAREAETRATDAMNRLEDLLVLERGRADRWQKALRSPMVEVLE